MQGNTSTVFSSLANATALQFLDLSGDTGITGVIENGTAASSLCKSAMVGILVNDQKVFFNRWLPTLWCPALACSPEWNKGRELRFQTCTCPCVAGGRSSGCIVAACVFIH